MLYSKRRNSSAFTLIELLVVIAIIGLLITMLIPSLKQVLDLARSANCKGNLKSTGTAMAMYHSSHASLPFLRSRNSNGLTNRPTGTDAMNGQYPPENPAITSYMFLLCREKSVEARLFSCPGDSHAVQMKDITYKSGGKTYMYWDFYSEDVDGDHWRLCSYSVQTPYTNWGGDDPHESGFDDYSHPDLVVLADKTPKVDIKTNWGGWREDTDPEDYWKYISQNHRDIAMFNYFEMSNAVLTSSRPDVGIMNDNIYSASDKKDVAQYKGKDGVGQHARRTDSYLIGPVK